MVTGSYTQLRRLIAEPSTSGTYTDNVLADYLAADNDDVYAVASEIWQEKAADMIDDTYDVSADGASYKYSQRYENAIRLAQKFASKRKPVTNLWTKDPEEETEIEDEEETVQ